jgi:hypothetical protein
MEYSIEWLFNQIEAESDFQRDVVSNRLEIKISVSDFLEIKRIAKEMHKAEILKAFDESENYYYQYLINHKPKTDSETYYQETFVSKVKIKFTEEEWSELNNGSKGSDDETQPATYKVDTWTSFHHDKERIINAQISDEEIEEAAPVGNPTLEEGFIRGAKWYKEQIKNKL